MAITEERVPHTRVTGTKSEILVELEERAEGWRHLCKDKLADRAQEAADSIRQGSFSVKVGHTIFSVAE